MNTPTFFIESPELPRGPEAVYKPIHEQIATCAYFIYEAEGYPSGRALDHWLQAEEQLTMCGLHEFATASQ